MRRPNFVVERFRRVEFEKAYYGVDASGDPGNGVFVVPSPVDGGELRIIVSDGGDWDHVSVSRPKRCPNWIEMAHVKDLFFDPEECVVQFHPPKSQYVNYHPNCLHLWRPQLVTLPLPPMDFVGPIDGENH